MDALAFLKGTLLPPDDDEPQARLTLSGGERALIDRWLPAKAAPFVAAAVALPLLVWVVALVFARDRAKFLHSRDWLAQPLYFTVHLVVVRLFVTSYSRHFAAGLAYLVPAAAADARPVVGALLGWRGLCAAVLAAAPFVYVDLVHLSGRTFLDGPDSQGSLGDVAVSDHLLGALWTLQWILNAYTWVLLVSFAALTIRTIERHAFAAPLESMLHERHYRPFLLMSAQGASVMVGYTVATALYVFFSRGQTTDYIRLWATAGLLLLSFVPPWIRLKARVARSVREETHRLATHVRSARDRMSLVDDLQPPVTNEELGARVDVILAILELDHIERLYRDLGKSEGQAILLRLLAPLSTVVMKVLRPG